MCNLVQLVTHFAKTVSAVRRDRVNRLEPTPEAYIGTNPSKERVACLCEQISQITERT
jgi:hypothetical protein